MSALTTIRTSRRPRRCDRDCGVPIRAGERAEHTAIPPHGHDLLNSDRWIHLAAHPQCPDPGAMSAEELQAARAEMAAWSRARLADDTSWLVATAIVQATGLQLRGGAVSLGGQE